MQMKRNWFTQGVDRVLGIVDDLRQRLRRVLETEKDEDLTKEDWAQREKELFVIKGSETEGKIEGRDGVADYDHRTAGTASWRMAKELTNLGKKYKQPNEEKGR